MIVSLHNSATPATTTNVISGISARIASANALSSATSFSSFTARKKPSVPGWLLRRCCDHQCCCTGVWSDNFPQKPIAANHRCGSLFFYVFILQHFFHQVNLQEKSTSLIAAIEGGNKLAWEKIFLLHFLTAAIFYWPLCGRWAEKILSFVLCIYLYLIYIIGRSRSGSSSCSSLIAFSATWKPINLCF